MLDIFKMNPEMEEMIKLLMVLGILVLCNVAGGIYSNIANKSVKFDWKKLVGGIVKSLCVAFMCIGLSFALYTVPELSDVIGMQPKSMVIIAIGSYATKVIGQVAAIFGIKKEDLKVKKKEAAIDTEYVDM